MHSSCLRCVNLLVSPPKVRRPAIATQKSLGGATTDLYPKAKTSQPNVQPAAQQERIIAQVYILMHAGDLVYVQVPSATTMELVALPIPLL